MSDTPPPQPGSPTSPQPGGDAQMGTPPNPYAANYAGATNHAGVPGGMSAGEMYPGGQLPPGYAAEQGDATGGVIPYKNPQALVGYYLGIFGMFPCIGLPLSIAAFVLGIRGLSAAKKNPIVKGRVHAWIGIVLGGIATLYNTLILVAVVIAIAAGN